MHEFHPNSFLIFNILVLWCRVICRKRNYLNFYGAVLCLIECKNCFIGIISIYFLPEIRAKPPVSASLMIMCSYMTVSGQGVAGGANKCHLHAWSFSLLISLFPVGWIDINVQCDHGNHMLKTANFALLAWGPAKIVSLSLSPLPRLMWMRNKHLLWYTTEIRWHYL